MNPAVKNVEIQWLKKEGKVVDPKINVKQYMYKK